MRPMTPKDWEMYRVGHMAAAPAEVLALLLKERKAHPMWGPKKIQDLLVYKHGIWGLKRGQTLNINILPDSTTITRGN